MLQNNVFPPRGRFLGKGFSLGAIILENGAWLYFGGYICLKTINYRKKGDPKNRSIKVTNWVNLEKCVFLRYSRAATFTSY